MPQPSNDFIELKLNKVLALTLRRYAQNPTELEHVTVFKLKALIKLAMDGDEAFFESLTEFDTPEEKESFGAHLAAHSRTPTESVQAARKSFHLVSGGDEND